jgi:Cytochrome C oxidase subunit II, transmembrane domain/GIY-YIG catalytic domain
MIQNLLLPLFNFLDPVYNDAPEPWQLSFQDEASPSFEGIMELHNQIMFYLVIILLGVSWLLTSIIINFNSNSNKIVYKYANHGALHLHMANLACVMLIVFLCLWFNLSNILCEGSLDDLPNLMEFGDLYLTESFKTAKDTLSNQSGIYCFKCLETGAMYIGSSTNLGDRMLSHIFNHSSNLHLQRAIAAYGLSRFILIVVELCAPSALLLREQVWLDWLFSLNSKFRFNFLPTAGSSLGYKQSAETRAKVSASKKGLYTRNMVLLLLTLKLFLSTRPLVLVKI